MTKCIKGLVFVLNGPNLNLLGLRDPEKYGKETLDQIIRQMMEEARRQAFAIDAMQSNHEGILIDRIHGIASLPREDKQPFMRGIVLNAGGLTHSSVSLRDAVDFARSQGVPTVEVHLSNIHNREIFRHMSLLTEVCIEQVSGLGAKSYTVGMGKLIAYLKQRRNQPR